MISAKNHEAMLRAPSPQRPRASAAGALCHGPAPPQLFCLLTGTGKPSVPAAAEQGSGGSRATARENSAPPAGPTAVSQPLHPSSSGLRGFHG